MTSSQQLTVAEAFSESVIHDRHVVLGRDLQPFCLDHWEILNALKSPLLYGGKISILDMQLAALACSTGNSMEFYDATLRPHFGMRWWFRITALMPHEPALAAFNAYVDDYIPKFPHWRYDDGDESKCPGMFLTAARLVEAGHDPAKVRRMGIGEMNAWAMALLEAKGDPLKSVKSQAEVEAQREIAAEEAAQK
jgi:hypothetical protein